PLGSFLCLAQKLGIRRGLRSWAYRNLHTLGGPMGIHLSPSPSPVVTAEVEARLPFSGVAGILQRAALSTSLQQGSPARPRLAAGLAVRFRGVRGFACPHEAVACAFVGHRLIGLASRLHLVTRFRKGGVDPSVVAGIEPVYRGLDAGDRVLTGRRSIEDEGGSQIRAIGREAETLAPAPAEADHRKRATRCRQLKV